MISEKDKKWLRASKACAEIFSTCAKAKYWCFIIDKHGRIAGQGYNGVPPHMTHCNEGGCPRFLNDVPSGTPYDFGPGLCYSQHAEIGALSHGNGISFYEATLYVNGEPCLTCAKSIASAGIKRIVAISEDGRLHNQVTHNFLMAAKVELELVDDSGLEPQSLQEP